MARKEREIPKAKTLSLFDLQRMFPDEQSAIDYLAGILWKNGVVCPYCEGKNVKERKKRKNYHHCNDCNKDFTIRVGTIVNYKENGKDVESVDIVSKDIIIKLDGKQLDIKNDITIDGGGRVTIDAGCTPSNDRVSRVFEIAAGVTAELKGLTITGGKGTELGGGGILNSGTLTIEKCNITQNTANQGGGISNWRGTLTVINSEISNNEAYYGCGIYNGDNTSYGGGSTATIINSKILRNTTASSGGGIYNDTDSSLSIMNGSEISGNKATQHRQV